MSQVKDGESTTAEANDYIARRTRTHISLRDVSIDRLEADLPELEDDIGFTLSTPVADEGDEYQQFLASLVPNEQSNLSFLDEEDDEYHPSDEEEDKEDQRVHISKKELTELLWDSTRSHVPTVFAKSETVPTTSVADTKEMSTSSAADLMPAPFDTYATSTGPSTLKALQSTLKGQLSQDQCVQVASQMHKHLQLLLQTYYMSSQQGDHKSARVAETMVEEVRSRGDEAQQRKEAILSRLGSSSAQAEQDSIESRRVTRSLTAAHAAVAHPSIFELGSVRASGSLCKPLQTASSVDACNSILRKDLRELDFHLTLPKEPKAKWLESRFAPSEERLLAHGIKRWGTKKDSWPRIASGLLPSRSLHRLQRRYQYLICDRATSNPVRTYQAKYISPRRGRWVMEEDVRVVRGLLEFQDGKRFSRIAAKFLPYRNRTEVAKRWKFLKERFKVVPEGSQETLTSDSPIFLSAVVQYLEGELRKKAGHKTETDVISVVDDDENVNVTVEAVKSLSVPADWKLYALEEDEEGPQTCEVNNFHPALFFTSWSIATPATLLKRTCEHNWPSFIDENAGTFTEMAKAAVEQDPTEEEGGGSPDLLIRILKRMKGGEEEDEDKDSDYEQDELVSSGSEDEDEEFEREEMVMSDDSDEDEQSQVRELLEASGASKSKQLESTMHALERRILGKRAHQH